MRDMNPLPMALLFFVCIGGCTGGNSGEGAGDAPIATHLLVEGVVGECASFVDSATAFEVFSDALSSGQADVVGIAEAKVIEECSGAGGTHVFSSRTQEGKRFWLGNHACWISADQVALEAGVVVGLGSQTAAIFEGQDGWCMNYPGENSVFTTDISTKAMAWFASEAEARAFLDAL